MAFGVWDERAVAKHLNLCYTGFMIEETTVFRGSPSLLTRSGTLFLAFLVFAGALCFMVVARNQSPALFWGLGGLALLALIYFAGVVLVVKATHYEVTNERVRIRKGIISKRTDELELYRANDTSLIEPAVLRLFGLGTIEIRTLDSTTPTVHLEAIHSVRAVREKLRHSIEECRDRKRVRVTEFENPSPEG
jgi:uncharacterized membrane protein YdbT with pleckstrin-like domain